MFVTVLNTLVTGEGGHCVPVTVLDTLVTGESGHCVCDSA